MEVTASSSMSVEIEPPNSSIQAKGDRPISHQTCSIPAFSSWDSSTAIQSVSRRSFATRTKKTTMFMTSPSHHHFDRGLAKRVTSRPLRAYRQRARTSRFTFLDYSQPKDDISIHLLPTAHPKLNQPPNPINDLSSTTQTPETNHLQINSSPPTPQPCPPPQWPSAAPP
jgi:hypothetical protein